MSDKTVASSAESFEIGDLRITLSGVIALLKMNRPEKLNAMGSRFWGDMREALARLENDGRTRVLVITGSGDKAFSAGGDIASFGEMKTMTQRREYQANVMDIYRPGK